MKTLRRLAFPAMWGALFCTVTFLVQTRVLAPWDQAAMNLVAAHRQQGLADAMNWLFRLGFAPVDATIAMLWSVLLLLRSNGGWQLPSLNRGHRRPSLNALRGKGILCAVPAVALAPLLLFAVIGVQSGLRLVIDQPAPRAAYELQRSFAPEPVSAVLDRADAAARGTFEAATSTTSSGPEQERGSYPSGHAARSLFLALLAARWGTGKRRRWSGVLYVAAVAFAAAVGYSALYFGYHWPSDLLGGYLLAMAAHPAAARLLMAASTAF